MNISELFQVDKVESLLVVLFIPSVDRDAEAIDQEHWEEAALTLLGNLFGGATAFPQGRGVWRDPDSGTLVFDDPVQIHCFTSESAVREHAPRLREFLLKMGTETRQGAVGLVIDRHYLEIPIRSD